MSLYRTWRPKSFGDLVGQEAVVRTLRTALSSGKLAHAYLFSGPRGSGKTSAAKILARCIECVNGPTPDPDMTCENCRAIFAGAALDVIEVDAASNRGIEEIRALRESVKFAPSSMRSKVFIIDEAHMLTREGANAFLKTLEEPPAHAVFILATTAPEALPPTILSRCQRYAFRRIPVAVMIERMRAIATAEGIAIDDGALGAIAYRADGGLRDALTMLEQVASYAGASAVVDAATVGAAFGAAGIEYARGLVAAILGGDASAALRVVDAASDAGADMLGLVRGAIAEYRNLLVARIDPGLLSSDLAQADATAAIRLAERTPQPKVVRGLRLLADALAAGRNSGNPRLELETAVLRLVVQAEDPTLDALATRVALLELGATSAAAPPSVAATPSALPSPALGTAAAKPATLTEPNATSAGQNVQSASAAAEPALDSLPAAQQVPDASPAPQQLPDTFFATTPVPDVSPPVPPRPAVARAPRAPDAAQPPTLQQVRSLWDQIRLRAEEKAKPIRTPLSRATVDAVDAGAITIGIADPIQEGILRDRSAILESAVFDVLRVPLRVVIRTTRSTGGSGTSGTGGSGGVSSSGGTPYARTASRPALAPTITPGGDRPSASAAPDDGETDLLAYARKKLGVTETT